MRRKCILSAACLLLCGVMCSCSSGGDKKNESVTVINEVKDADIWIMKDTEEVRKTSVWGTATFGKLGKDKQATRTISELGGPGLCAFRMIDKDKIYYSANEVKLEAGYTLKITGSDFECILEVTEADGKTKQTYEVFSASL